MNSGDYWLTGEEVAEMFDHCELVNRVNPKKGEKAALDFGNLAAMVKEYKELKTQREQIKELDQYIATERLKELLAYDE
jgi:ADP-heptose:LPS heptosyltransferase